VKPADRRLLASTRGGRAHLAATVALGAVAAGLVVAQAALLARVIDRAFLHGAALADVEGELIALAAVVAGRGLLSAAFEVSGRLGAMRVMSELRRRVVDHLLLRRPGALAAERSGELAATAVGGVDALERYFSRYLPQAALAALVPIGILGYLATVDLVACVILAVTLPLIPVFMALIGLDAEGRTRERRRALSLLSAHFLDVVRGLATLRANNRAAAQAETIGRVGERYRQETMATLRIAFLSALVLELLAMIGTALVAAVVGVQLVSGAIDLEAGLVVLLLAPELYLPLREVGAQYHASADGLAAAERLFEVLETPAAVTVPDEPVRPPDPADMPIRFEGVVYSYPGRGAPALRGVDLELRPGETVALVGPSGSGKSTLVSLLLRFADPDEGRVACGNVDLRDVDPAQWRRRIAWVPQRPHLVAGTLADNIRLADPGASDRRVRAAAAAAGLLGVAERLPDGLATRVGDGGRALSAGQAQRVALARAFLRDAPLVVCDEPTAHLDPESAAAVADAIERLMEGRTVLLVVHHPELARRADRVVTLEEGRVVATAPGEQAPARAAAAATALRPAQAPAAGGPGAAGPPAGGRRRAGALRRAAALASPRRGRLALSVALGAGAVMAATGLLSLSGYLISKAALQPPILSLTVAIVGVRFFGIARAVLRYYERTVSHDLAFRVLAGLRRRFFERLVPLVPGGLPRLRRGDLLSRFVADVDRLQDLYLRALAPPVAAALAGGLAVWIAFLLLPAAGWVLLAALLAGGVAVPLLTARAARAAGRRQGRARAALTDELLEVVEQAPEIAAWGREAERAGRVARADGELVRLARRDALAGGLAAGLQTLLSAGSAVALVAVGVPAVAEGRLEGVLLAVLPFLGLAAYEAVTPLPQAAQHLDACADAAARIEDVLEAPAPVREPERPRPLPAGGSLVAEGVRFRYPGSEEWVLDGADLELKPGRRVALVGPSGSGKSTLANLLVRFADPQEGRVTLGGVDVRELSGDALRGAVRLAGQDAHLFNTSIRENVRLARPEASDEEVDRALEAAGLGPWIASLPEGAGTFVGEDGAQVSGGQRRRIAFARALLADARFLVLDEPTAHLDPEGAEAFLRTVAERAGDRGVLVITHTLAGLDAYDEVLVLDGGRLVPAERAQSARLAA
jgi:ATP-binding cassette subfamily C protein CydCD